MSAKSEVERVDMFLQQIDDLDIFIHETARTLFFPGEDRGDPFIREKSLSDTLHILTQFYRKAENTQSKNQHAAKLSYWIDKAYMNGVIRQGEGLARKVRELSDEINAFRMQSNKYLKKT